MIAKIKMLSKHSTKIYILQKAFPYISACASSSLNNGSMDNVNIPGVTLSPLSESKLSEELNGEGVYVTITPRDMDINKKKKRRSLALSKVFGKSRTRRSIAVCDPSILEGELGEAKYIVACQDDPALVFFAYIVSRWVLHVLMLNCLVTAQSTV